MVPTIVVGLIAIVAFTWGVLFGMAFQESLED